MGHRAIALISGGLDSLLAARVIMEQGIEVRGVSFVMQFASRDIQKFKERVKESTSDAGVNVEFRNISDEFLNILKKPEHGYGANMNPCIDCKILMLRLAGEMMREGNADFVITGEVLGERPMSQRKDALDIIKRESRLDGYLLRPLSARLLEATFPEKEGIINREELLDISGRSRKRQLELAKKYGINRFFAPAGGCLLTDPIFSRKLRDLVKTDSLIADNINLLKYGRHFRIDEHTKVIVGRDERENREIRSARKDNDFIVRLRKCASPDLLFRGDAGKENIKKAAALVASYSRQKNAGNAEISVWGTGRRCREVISVKPLASEEVERMRI